MTFLKNTFLHSPTPEDSRSVRTARWLWGIAALLVWSAALCTLSLYFARPGYSLELFLSYFQRPILFLLNWIPVLLIVALFFFLSNRIWITVLCSSLVVMIPTLINYYKLLSRNDPLLASDITFLSEAANISTNYSFPVSTALVLALCGILISIVGSAFLLRARITKHRWTRLVGLAAVVLAGAILYPKVYRNYYLYKDTSNTGVSLSYGKTMSEWSETDQYVSRGFIYPLLYSIKTSFNEKPDGYSEETAQTILSAYADSDIPESQKINFISIMMEAYNDFSKFGLKFEQDPYAFFHELQAESYSGELVTNIFAGGTIDTERQYITGSSDVFTYRKSADSYARYFSSQGYSTEFCHPCYDWFYNRRNVAEYFGFDSSHFFEDRYAMPEGWGIMPDDQFFPDLITLYKEGTQSGPYFNFSVTYQNHGPYMDDQIERGIEYVSHDGLSDYAYNIVNSYLGGIAETDAALRTFFNYFRADTQPVVIVLFGDHNPWLGEAASVYPELGINLDLDTDEGFYNYYSTPYVVWANDAAKQALGIDLTGDGGNLSPCFLMTRIFDLCGWEGSAFMQLNRELFRTVDVISVTGLYREDGLLTDTLSQTTSELLKNYKIAEYYRMRDAY